MNKLDEQNGAVEAYIGALLGGDNTDAQRVPVVPRNFIAPIAEVAGDRLDFMSFQVGGLKFALDTAQVKTVIPFPRGRGYANGRPVRLMAAGPRPACHIIDTRRRIFPEGHAAHADPRPYGFLILLSMDALALACDDLEHVLRVAADQVQWRHERHARPWLAGMVNQPKCAVLDVEVWRMTAAPLPASQH